MIGNQRGVRGSFRALWILVGAAALFLPGCWLFGGEPSGMPEKTFGVYNAFPEHPRYLTKTHPEAAGDGDVIKSLSLKSRVTQGAIRFLEAKGYQAVAVDSPKALEDGAVDILIQVIPLAVYRGQGMAGYGFSDREMLWGILKRPAASFVALQVSMKRRFTSRVIDTGPKERFFQLGRDLPQSWDALSQDEREAFERNLEENIDKAVYLSLSRLKI